MVLFYMALFHKVVYRKVPNMVVVPLVVFRLVQNMVVVPLVVFPLDLVRNMVVVPLVVFPLDLVQSMVLVQNEVDVLLLVVVRNEYNDELLILFDDGVVDMVGMEVFASILVPIEEFPYMVLFHN